MLGFSAGFGCTRNSDYSDYTPNQAECHPSFLESPPLAGIVSLAYYRVIQKLVVVILNLWTVSSPIHRVCRKIDIIVLFS